ncbi:helix-turn-helix transcriptional regulator [Actinomadura soli]|uniref:Helix-turn-helix transcriptional regulator n=1 Tax=Actinomadura soli TaxID=2508997 RepID=A0A5C4JB98_9ACTN|nr:helix-turn-helix domain-containing protein [Actinomadura soli]TMQ99166.1 helix-turn-helix transcriptional regulator [Actinomadura soli]
MTNQTVGRPGLPDDPRADVAEPTASCPVEITLDALRGRWTTLVLRELLRRDHSFSELRQALPTLSDKVLTDRLAHLVRSGVVDRHHKAGWPPRTRYALTPHGRRLGPVLQALWDWGNETAQPPDSVATS